MKPTFTKYIKDARKSNKLTLQEVERLTGISNSYLSQVENGKRGIPAFEIQAKLAEVYKINLIELLVVSGLMESTAKALNLLLMNMTEKDGSLKSEYQIYLNTEDKGVV